MPSPRRSWEPVGAPAASTMEGGSVRKPVLVVFLVCIVAVFALGIAQADGPGGSSEHHGRCTDSQGNSTNLGPGTTGADCPAGTTGATVYDNDVTCGDNNSVGGFDVFVGPSGIEVCNDGGAAGPQGRVMASGDPASQSGFVGADGDKDNSPEQAQGWLGVSSESGTPVACGDADGNHDLSHGTSDDDINDCIPS
jgi:hypothetical protein